jgi:hypothetical protein
MFVLKCCKSCYSFKLTSAVQLKEIFKIRSSLDF